MKFSPFGDQFLTRVKAAAGRTAEDMNADDAGFALFHSVRRQRKQEAGLLVADHFISVQTRRLCVCVCVCVCATVDVSLYSHSLPLPIMLSASFAASRVNPSCRGNQGT